MKKEVIEIQVKGTGEGVKSVDKLKGSISETKKETQDFGSTLDGVTGGAASKFKGLKGGVSSVITSFKSLKIAIIGTGIGALLIAVLAVGKAFTSSEEGQNKFAKIMGVIGSVTGNLIDLLADLGEKIIWAFENPKQAINDFVKLIKENIINRFNGILELIPQMGKAIKQLFKGDFSGAAETAVNAVAKVTLGTENLTESIRNASTALKEFGKEVAEDARIAAEIADKRAKADRIERSLIVGRAKADRDIADLRFKSEQRDLFTAKERVEFLKEASDIAEAITNKEIYAASLRLQAQRAENKLTKSTKEDKEKEAQLEATLIGLTTQKLNLQKRLQTSITTFQNEENARKQKLIDDEIKAKEVLAEKRIKDNEELQKFLEDEETIISNAEDIRIEKEYQARLTKEEQDKKTLDDEQKIVDTKIAMQYALAGAIGSALGQISQLFEQGTAASKAAALAEIVIGTGIGFIQGLDIAQKGAKAAGPAAPFAFPIFYATQIAAVLGAVGKAKNILSQVKGGSSGGGGSASAPQIPTTAQTPQFNVVGSSETNQLATSIGQQEQQPVQAYVVSNEVTTAQSLDRNIVESASFG